MLISHTWTEVSIEGEDEDGNYKSGYQIVFGESTELLLISLKNLGVSQSELETQHSVKAGDIWAELV